MRYRNVGFGLSIPLANTDGYEVVCQCTLADSRNNNKDYNVDFWIIKKDIGVLSTSMIDTLFIPDIDARSLKNELCSIVEEMHNNGKFDESISSYEYMLKCFDTGDNLLSAKEF